MEAARMNENPYVCRLLIRIDRIIYALKGRHTVWLGGRLCFLYGPDPKYGYHGVQCSTHFPGWMFHWACNIQNRFIWTRKILNF